MEENINEEVISQDIESNLNTDDSIKIIFLSGDGVIFENKNNKLSRNLDNIIFNEDAIRNLKENVDKTGAFIIITTSVRNYPGGKALLDLKMENAGLKEHLIGYTPMRFGVSRPDKIAEKLNNSKYIINRFVIIDRRKDMGDKLNEWLIPCRNGIDNLAKEKVLTMLDGN